MPAHSRNTTVPFFYVAVVGLGPCGIAAAVQLARQDIKNVLLIESDCPGGLLHQAQWVENYLGFPNGISGSQLTGIMTQQLYRWTSSFRHDELTRITPRTPGLFELSFRSPPACLARTVLIASGTRPRHLTDMTIAPDAQPHVFDSILPLRDRKNQRIAILGAGDAAFDYALQLAPANDIFILNRDAASPALPLLQQRAAAQPRITCLSLLTAERLTHHSHNLCLTGSHQNRPWTVEIDALLLAIGRKPELSFLHPDLKIDKPLTPGLFIGGDCINGLYRQTAIAAADGIRAAMQIANYLKEQN